MKETFFTAKRLAGTAVLLALVIVLQAFGGAITVGTVSLNFTLIPIVLGAMLFGPFIGAFLGFACGVVVLIQVMMGGNAFYTLIWSNDPLITTLICLVKTTVAGLVCGFLYDAIKKKNAVVASFVSAGIVPIVNTLLFLIGCLCMSGTLYEMASANGQNVLTFVLVTIVTFNFFIELTVNLLVAPALRRVIEVVGKRF